MVPKQNGQADLVPHFQEPVVKLGAHMVVLGIENDTGIQHLCSRRMPILKQRATHSIFVCLLIPDHQKGCVLGGQIFVKFSTHLRICLIKLNLG